MNLYEYARSRSSRFVDPYGLRMRGTPDGPVELTDENRRKPPHERMKVITVKNCTILFIYGHNWTSGSDKEGTQWIWNIVPSVDGEKQCSYAALGTCFSNLIPNEISLPGYNPDNHLSAKNPGDGEVLWVEVLDMWRAVRRGLGQKGAEAICKACDCKEVTIESMKMSGDLGDFKDKSLKVPCSSTKQPDGDSSCDTSKKPS
jgi:hypothetical protein